MTTDELIDVGLHHLARFAFFTRDNPFVSSRAAVRLQPAYRAILVDLLDNNLDCEKWLKSDGAQSLLRDIRVGCVPRNVQLAMVDGQAKVGVVDVHAFLQAPLFWWLVSILWCLTAGRLLDPILDDGIKGYRLHPGFIERPDERGLMFRDHRTSNKAWKGFAKTTAREFPGEVLATTTVWKAPVSRSTLSESHGFVSAATVAAPAAASRREPGGREERGGGAPFSSRQRAAKRAGGSIPSAECGCSVLQEAIQSARITLASARV